MRCLHCGFDSPAVAAFCPRCGQRLSQPGPSAPREFAVGRLWPSWWRFLGGIIFASVPLLAAISIFFTNPPLWHIAPVLLLISGALFGLVYLGRRGLGWSLTSERLIERRGILSTRRREMELADIRSVEVNRSLLQKLVGIGTIIVASAASADFAIRLEGIAEPDRIAEAIRQARLRRMT